MMHHPLHTTWRSLRKNKTHAIINMLGLSLSIGIAIVIFSIIRFEKSFDTWHAHAPRIYQLLGHDRFGGINSHIPQGAIHTLNHQVPGVERAVNVYKWTPSVIRVGTDNLKQQHSYFAPPGIFQLIDVRWIAGSPSTSLGEPYQVVLDEPTARRLFGSAAKAMGNTIRYDNTLTLTVSGIIGELPANTQFRMSMILSYATLLKYMEWYKDDNYWGGGDSYFQGFVLLKPGVQPATVEAGLNQWVARNAHQSANKRFQLVHLPEQHFNAIPDIDFFNYATPRWLLYTLGAIGVFLLLIASINFVNMATVQAIQRNKSTGIRKILGSSRYQLIGSFLLETAVIVSGAIVAGALLAHILLPFTNRLLNTQVAEMDSWDTGLIGFLLLMGFSLTLLSGLYPAVVLSGFRPVQMLQRGPINRPGDLFTLRRILVVTQFTIALVLVICTLIGVKQLHYFQHAALGFDKASVVTVPMPDSRNEGYRERLRNGLLRSAAISDVTFGLTTPSGTSGWWWANAKHHGLKDGEQQWRQQFIDTNYLHFFKIPLLAGRSFTRADSSRALVLINEQAAQDMGYASAQEALGQTLQLWQEQYTIAGIVRNYQSQSLRSGTTPHVYLYNRRFQTACIRVQAGQQAAALRQIEQAWKALFPDHFFEYSFLDENLKGFYGDERKLASFLTLFSILGILIGCLGVYGLVTYVCVRKTKEIGIRKVLGAGVLQIMAMLNKEFCWLIIIAFVLAAPIAGWIMHHFLEEYAHRIRLPLWVFAASGAGAVVVTLLTTSFQAIKAAIANPVKSLRNE